MQMSASRLLICICARCIAPSVCFESSRNPTANQKEKYIQGFLKFSNIIIMWQLRTLVNNYDIYLKNNSFASNTRERVIES